MKSPQGFILYRIWYENCLAYIGRTKQPLQARIRGHMFQKPMHRAICIHNTTKIDYAMFKTEADMNLYEIYFINKWKPPLNVDDKAKDELTISLPEVEWTDFLPVNWEDWKKSIPIGNEGMMLWNKLRNDRAVKAGRSTGEMGGKQDNGVSTGRNTQIS